jgi:hypothetical protein
MLEWLQAATGAHWLTLGLLMLVLEVLVPGAFLMWFGFGAIVTGLIAWLIPSLGWQGECLLFAALSIASVLLFRRWRQSHPPASTDQPLLNNRVASLIGRVLDLSEPIVNGRARVQIGDALWTIVGADLPAGSKVRISGARGLDLIVEAVSLP